MREKVWARGRLTAAQYGPRPDSLPDRPRPAKRAKATTAEVQADIQGAVQELRDNPSDWVGLADLRDRLGDRHSQAEIDDALRGMLGKPGVRIIPVANTKSLKARDHEAALSIGGEDSHMIQLGDAPAVRAQPPARAPAKPPNLDAASEPQHVQRMADAYGSLAQQNGDWVSIADLREQMGGMSREDQDKALHELWNRPGWQIEQETNQKALRQRDRDGAFRIGGRDQHVISYRPPEPTKTAPARKRSFSRADAAAVGAKLETAATRDEAHAHLSGLTVPQMRQVAELMGVYPGSKATKAKILDAIVDNTTGVRLDSKALGR